MKVFGNNFQIPCAESKVPNWKFMIWHFWFPASKKKLFPNTFIWSVLKVPLLYFFKNVSQFLPNQGFRSIQVNKVHFLKRTHIWHLNSCFLVFSYHVNIIQKQNFECILPSHLFAFSNGVYSFKNSLECPNGV